MYWRGVAPDTEARIGALIGTLFVYSLGLQAARMFLHPLEVFSDISKLDWVVCLGFFGSTLLFNGGFALFAAGLLLLGRRRAVRTVETAALQLVAVLLLVAETACHVYFFQTGATLDWPLFAYSLTRPADVALLGFGSVQRGTWEALAAATLLVLIAPWVAGWRARRDRADPVSLERGRRFAWIMVAAGPLVAALGFLPTTSLAQDTSSPRDAVLNLIATALPLSTSGTASSSAEHAFDIEIEPDPRLPPRPPRNVVVVIFESMRHQSTSLSPLSPDTTPFLKELAGRSLVVDRFEAVIPQTKKALRHIFCGFEASHSVSAQALTLGVMTRCLPNLLRERGYRTGFIQTADENFEHRPASVFSMGFQDFIGPTRFSHEGFERANYLGFDDESMLGESRRWLEKNRGRPFLFAYLTVNAHHDCLPLTRHGYLSMAEDAHLNCYLNAIRHDDFFLKALIQQYKDLGIYENTLFVITGDHGEAFGEHGRRTHNDVPYEEGLHVPFVLHDPTGMLVRPGTLPGPASEIDITPTLVELLGYRLRKGQFHGRSLLSKTPGRVVHASCYGEQTCIASVQGNLKFIEHFGRRKGELFDLADDPLEQHNLASERPEVVKERRSELLGWDEQLRQTYDWFELHRTQPEATGSPAPRLAGTGGGG